MARQRRQPDEFRPAIRRGRLEEVTIYEISAEELEILARGSNESVYLNFAIFLLSVAVSFTVALLTTTIASDRIFIVFVLVALVGFVSGAVLLTLWFKNRISVPALIRKIKSRVPSAQDEPPSETSRQNT